MSEFKQTFNSSLGKKLIMALTGLFLCTFLIVHIGGNLLLFLNYYDYIFNLYAILVHAVYALILTIQNRKARPVAYAHVNKSPATWSSKNMGLLGSILFLFIVIHMSDFWFNYKYSNKMGFKEYRTDLATDKTTSVDYVPTSPDFE